MKWSKAAALLAATAVLIVAFVLVKNAHADSMNEVHQSLTQSRQETTEIKTQLEDVKSEKLKLSDEVKLKDEKIQQLEKENAELKG